MPKFTPIFANDLAGCVAGCNSLLSQHNKGPDFVQALRRIAAARSGTPNELSSERAGLFIMDYEKKITGARKDRVLEKDETAALFGILEKEMTQERKAIFQNTVQLSQADLDKASYLANEIKTCRFFAKSLS